MPASAYEGWAVHRERVSRFRVNPRVRMAARLYASGAAKSKREAAEAVGLSPGHFYLMSTQNPSTMRLVDEVDRQIEDKSIDMSSVLRTVGREAISRLRQLMAGSANEHIVLKAAQDLADRNPETSKVQRHELIATHITTADAKALAAALVEGAKIREQFSLMAEGDVVKVDPEKEIQHATLRLVRGESEEPLCEGEESPDEVTAVEADAGAEDQANAPRSNEG